MICGRYLTHRYGIEDGVCLDCGHVRAASGMETRQGGNEVPSRSDESPVAATSGETPDLSTEPPAE